jgi:hypothetical protein
MKKIFVLFLLSGLIASSALAVDEITTISSTTTAEKSAEEQAALDKAKKEAEEKAAQEAALVTATKNANEAAEKANQAADRLNGVAEKVEKTLADQAQNTTAVSSEAANGEDTAAAAAAATAEKERLASEQKAQEEQRAREDEKKKEEEKKDKEKKDKKKKEEKKSSDKGKSASSGSNGIMDLLKGLFAFNLMSNDKGGGNALTSALGGTAVGKMLGLNNQNQGVGNGRGQVYTLNGQPVATGQVVASATKYGYAGDEYGDTNSLNAVGNRNNQLVGFSSVVSKDLEAYKLNDGTYRFPSVAISKETAAKLGVSTKSGDVLNIKTQSGESFYVAVDDTIPSNYNNDRVDFFTPSGQLAIDGQKILVTALDGFSVALKYILNTFLYA